MEKPKQLISSAVLIVFTSLLLSACGGGGSESEDETSTTPTPTEAVWGQSNWNETNWQ